MVKIWSCVARPLSSESWYPVRSPRCSVSWHEDADGSSAAAAACSGNNLSVSKQSLADWGAGECCWLSAANQRPRVCSARYSRVAGGWLYIYVCVWSLRRVDECWCCFGRKTYRVCVWGRDMMSLWAALELMRQQTCVSCQCHPEGDVSRHPTPPTSWSFTHLPAQPSFLSSSFFNYRSVSLAVVQCLSNLPLAPLLSSPSDCLSISPCLPFCLSSLLEVSLEGAALLLTVG